MQYRTLPHTDLKVSRACFGAMTFGGQTDEAAARRMVGLALEAGINFFDTANIYNAGASETMLGRILGERRREVILASKVGGLGGKAARGPRLARRQVIEEAEQSLRRLGADYLDIYYLHQPDYETPVGETLAAMDELVRAGKVRYPATSNHASWQVTGLIGRAELRGARPSWIAQQMYNVLARRLEPEFLPMAKERGVSVIAYNPLAGGLLTGKHRPDTITPGTRFDGNKQYQARYWREANFAAVEKLRRTAADCGKSLVELALGWLLHHTAADCIVLGASKVVHLEENLRACETAPLPAEALAAVEDVWLQVGGIAPRYNR